MRRALRWNQSSPNSLTVRRRDKVRLYAAQFVVAAITFLVAPGCEQKWCWSTFPPYRHTHTHHPQKKDSWKRIKENSRQLPQLSMAWYTMPYHIVCYIYRQATKNGVVQTQLQLQIQIHLDTRVEMPRQPNLVTHKSKKKKKIKQNEQKQPLTLVSRFSSKTFLHISHSSMPIYSYIYVCTYI